jgi:hypothetical protein
LSNFICPLCGATSPKGHSLPCPVDCDATPIPLPAIGDRVEILAGWCRGKFGVVLRHTPKGRVVVGMGPYSYTTLLPKKVRRVAE